MASRNPLTPGESWTEEISFEDYMHWCLYDPEYGYYTTSKKVVGKDGDFITSAHLTPLFSRLLGQAFVHYDRLLGSPSQLDLVELGADRGLLGTQLSQYLGTSHPELWGRARYTSVDFGDTIPDQIHGIVFCNEFFDALPVRRIVAQGGKLLEVFVRLGHQGQLVEVLQETQDPRVQNFLTEGFGQLRDGWTYEVNLAMVEKLEELARKVVEGVIVSFDYGYLKSEYAEADRSAGTLMCYSGQQAHEDPYRAPGKEDLTAHVNFQIMIDTGRSLGWQSEELMSQRDFLMRWGLEAELADEEASGILQSGRLSERLGIRDLIVSGGISDSMRVLIQHVRS